MAVSAKLQWVEGLKFSVQVGEGRKIELNSAEQMTEAFTPMELFLVALAGCTSMDLQWILTRERQEIEGLEISIQGTRREVDPRYYEKIDLHFLVRGKHVRRDAVERAIRLSQDEYCSVKAMLKDSVKVNITYTIAGDMKPEETFTYVPSAKTMKAAS